MLYVARKSFSIILALEWDSPGIRASIKAVIKMLGCLSK